MLPVTCSPDPSRVQCWAKAFVFALSCLRFLRSSSSCASSASDFLSNPVAIKACTASKCRNAPLKSTIILTGGVTLVSLWVT